MGSNQAPEPTNSGIALFMVISAISVLSILVTEFAYVAQINQRMAFDALDQVKAHYLAKSGFKLSLLRLKAYQQVSALAGGVAGAQAVPKQILEKIWSFPFFYPIPTNIPGLSPADKDRIEKFQKASGLEGRFSASISSESSKFNLNQILEPFAQMNPPAPAGTPTPSPSGSPSPSPRPSPTSHPFDPQEARKQLYDYLAGIFTAKLEADEEFASEYRDFRLADLVDSIASWADRNFDSVALRPTHDSVPPKKAPYFSVTELHMVPGMNDELYDLFAPHLTVVPTQGINVNTVSEMTLRGIIPRMTKTEAGELLKRRETEEEGSYFKTEDDFFKYLLENVSAFHKDQREMDRFKEDLGRRNIRLVTDETHFKITVHAQVNQSSRLLEAWVSMEARGRAGPNPAASPTASPAPGQPPEGKPGAGLRITYMRIL